MNRQTTQAAQDVAWLMAQSGQTATVRRPSQVDRGTFFGPHESGTSEIGEVQIEMQQLSPADLAEIGADMTAHVLATADVTEHDLVDFDGSTYRVTDVKTENYFGEQTHKTLHLERRKA